jgi:uncharacterized protein
MEQVDTSIDTGAPFRLKALPILSVVLMGLGIPVLAAVTIYITEHFVHLVERPDMRWIAEGYVELAQLAYAYIGIRLMRRVYPGDYGLELPERKSYLLQAVFWGLVLGVVATLVDQAPEILAQRPPKQLYPLTSFNLTGWFSFQALIAGPSDEVLLRGLLVTYLAMAMPGRVSFRGIEMNGAGVVVAAFYALAHILNFFFYPFAMTLAQLAYLFVQGVFLAYWFEKSKSLLAPIVGHSVLNVAQQGLIFAMVAAWS